MWWMLAREVLRLRGTIPRTPDGWSVMVDMFFYRDPEEVEKQQQEEAAAKAAAAGTEEAPAGLSEWDVSSAPQAGSINPALVSGEGEWFANDRFVVVVLTVLLSQVLLTGLLIPTLDLLTGLPTPRLLLVDGAQRPLATVDGTRQIICTPRTHRSRFHVLLRPHENIIFSLILQWIYMVVSRRWAGRLRLWP
jgi:40S ribosomal protein SA C-terminus